ncbi:MAG: HD domain-containing protein [Candidatus Omnitrophica bacterium]|jgi:poly(A) polymerase|nr:HD domain-containing protein [Candidatus Omnitrophota bacterium]MDD5079350.1 HD domain-containing protein [Candidatus Omnitrophota bacterium]
MKNYSVWFNKNKELLKEVLSLAREKKARLYIVGGVLRDIFLGRERLNPDIDFCIQKGAIKFARELSRRLKAGFVLLDDEHGSGRVVKKMKGNICTLDFSDFKGADLKADLLHRDFTINSMAVEMEDAFSGKAFEDILIDPWSGRKDLKAGSIRQVNKKSFEEDPLRILRAFSLSAAFGLRIDKDTLKSMSGVKNKLTGIAAERVRDEIFKILASSRSFQGIAMLDTAGLLDILIPGIKAMRRLKKGGKDHFDVWRHTLDTVRHLELLLKRISRSKDMADYLERDISSGRKRRDLLILAGLLHDIGKPKTFRREKGKISFHGHERLGASMAHRIAESLKLSREEVRMLWKIVFLHLRPGYMVTNPVLTPRAKFRFFRDAGDEAVSVLLLSQADERATQGYLLLDKIRKRYKRVIPGLIREYFRKQDVPKQKRLINGNDLIEHFKLEPSALIGRLLSRLEELQAIGKIKTRADGFKQAVRILKEERRD